MRKFRPARSGPDRGRASLAAMTDALVHALAQWPDVVLRLLDAHVAGPDGRCRGCTSQVRPAPRWPCRLADLAARAAQEDGRVAR